MSFPRVDGYNIEAVPWRGGELEDEILDLAGHSCNGLSGSFYNILSFPSYSSLFHSTGSLCFLGTNPLITALFYFSSLQFLDHSNSHIGCLSKKWKPLYASELSHILLSSLKFSSPTWTSLTSHCPSKLSLKAVTSRKISLSILIRLGLPTRSFHVYCTSTWYQSKYISFAYNIQHITCNHIIMLFLCICWLSSFCRPQGPSAAGTLSILLINICLEQRVVGNVC